MGECNPSPMKLSLPHDTVPSPLDILKTLRSRYLEFIVRFQIGGGSRLKNEKYGIPTLQNSGKRSPISKKVGKKGEKGCPI